ncbi:MAG: PEGA domain-containing protein [Methanolinea sp.]|jgi:hypothetical protein|nr:PEGA domain-containing protein [Methanolinea sp.]
MKPVLTIILVSILLILVTLPAGAEETLPGPVTPAETQAVTEAVTLPVSIGGDIGYFAISSVPSGADVIFDGKYLGETPIVAEVYTTATPSHTISVSRQGYKTWIRTFSQNPAPGQTIDVNADLEPVVQTGSIQVTSSPSGAIARLDGGETLVTPGTFRYVPPGYHTVELALSGYFPYSTSVNVAAGGTSGVSASLSPMQTTGSLRVTSSPSGAETYVDEIYRGYTPMTIGSLSTGRHAVRLSLAGYQDYTRTVEIESGSQSSFSVTLTPVYQPTTGDIVVTSVPGGAAIYLDGSYRGTTSERNPFDITGVAPGSHTVSLLKNGYQDYSADVTVLVGKTTSVSAVLTPGSVTPATGDVYVESSPSGADVYLDNAYKGFAPLTIHNVPAGSHVVMLRMSGYQDFQYTVQVNAGQTASVIGGLSPVPTTVPTKSPLSPAVPVLGVLAGLALLHVGRK